MHPNIRIVLYSIRDDIDDLLLRNIKEYIVCGYNKILRVMPLDGLLKIFVEWTR